MAQKVMSTLCPSTAPMEKSLASHMISDSLFQSGVAMIRALISLSLISPKAHLHFSSNSNFVSFSSNLHSGLDIFEKSFMNLL